MNIVGASVVIAILAAVFAVGGAYMRYRVYRDLSHLIEIGDAEGFFARIDRPLAKATLSPFARERLRFAGLCLKGDAAAMAEEFNGLMSFKLNGAQRAMLLSDGFNGFAQIGDAKRCRRILAEMPRCGMTDQQLHAYRRHFDLVLAGKPAGYKRELESKYATLRGRRRGYAAYLLSYATQTTDRSQCGRYQDEAARLYEMPFDQLSRRIHVNTTV